MNRCLQSWIAHFMPNDNISVHGFSSRPSIPIQFCCCCFISYQFRSLKSWNNTYVFASVTTRAPRSEAMVRHHYFPFVCFYITLFIWNCFSCFLSIWLVYASSVSFLLYERTHIYQFYFIVEFSCVCEWSHNITQSNSGCLLVRLWLISMDSVFMYIFFVVATTTALLFSNMKLDVFLHGTYESRTLPKQMPDDPYWIVAAAT